MKAGGKNKREEKISTYTYPKKGGNVVASRKRWLDRAEVK